MQKKFNNLKIRLKKISSAQLLNFLARIWIVAVAGYAIANIFFANKIETGVWQLLTVVYFINLELASSINRGWQQQVETYKKQLETMTRTMAFVGQLTGVFTVPEQDPLAKKNGVKKEDKEKLVN